MIQDALLKDMAAGSRNIVAASYYVEQCRNTGICSADQFTKELQGAGERLTYACEEMHEKGFKSSGDALADHEAMQFDCILSARAKDREGDVIDQKGLTADDGLQLDQQMPLLWHHIRTQPVGAFRKAYEQTIDETPVSFSIVNTAFGRDSAMLVKCGGLRMSQGFIPLDAVPLTKKTIDGKQVVTSWHVKKSLTIEGSLVGIPANAAARILRFREREKAYEQELDAIRSVFAGGNLETDFVKAWAKEFHDNRPVVVSGATLEKSVVEKCGCSGETAEKSADCPVKKRLDELQDQVDSLVEKMGESSKSMPTATTTLTTEYSETVDKVWGQQVDAVKGSYEWIAAVLSMSAKQALMVDGKVFRNSNIGVVATFPAYAVVTCSRYDSDSGYAISSYRASWSMVDGMPTWSSSFTETEMSVVIDGDELPESTEPADGGSEGGSDGGAMVSSLDAAGVVKDISAKALQGDASAIALVRRMADVADIVGKSEIANQFV